MEQLIKVVSIRYGVAQAPSLGPLITGGGGPLQRISYTPMSEQADPVDRGTLATELWAVTGPGDMVSTRVSMVQGNRGYRTGWLAKVDSCRAEVGTRIRVARDRNLDPTVARRYLLSAW